jgi:N-carbamoyl-L-amino-acid hydrolase
MRVNRQRLERALEVLSRIGGTARGGLTRLALSNEDKLARDEVVSWMREEGLRVIVDKIGNIFGERPGSEELPPVVIGSHLDSVPCGGRYDGQVGVVSGLEVVRTLNDFGVRTRHPITVAIFTNEEGARFSPPMLGSGVVAQRIRLEEAYETRDERGCRLVEELKRIGYLGKEWYLPAKALHAYLELHIEQGPVLEEEGCAIGVVEGIVGISWCDITLVGAAAHAGPTRMARRRDALVAAAEIVRAVRSIPMRVCEEMVATVGHFEVYPNVSNVVPGKVTMTTDIRDPHDQHVAEALQLLREGVAIAGAREGVEVEVSCRWRVAPVRFHPEVVGAIERAAGMLRYRSRRMFSFAGHDAQYMSMLGPTGMIFVPSRGGVSHCEEEFTSVDDIEKGAMVLLLAALELAGHA